MRELSRDFFIFCSLHIFWQKTPTYQLYQLHDEVSRREVANLESHCCWLVLSCLCLIVTLSTLSQQWSVLLTRDTKPCAHRARKIRKLFTTLTRGVIKRPFRSFLQHQILHLVFVSQNIFRYVIVFSGWKYKGGNLLSVYSNDTDDVFIPLHQQEVDVKGQSKVEKHLMRKETGRCEGNQKFQTRRSLAFDKKPNHKKSPMLVTKPKIIS